MEYKAVIRIQLNTITAQFCTIADRCEMTLQFYLADITSAHFHGVYRWHTDKVRPVGRGKSLKCGKLISYTATKSLLKKRGPIFLSNEVTKYRSRRQKPLTKVRSKNLEILSAPGYIKSSSILTRCTKKINFSLSNAC